MKLRTPYRDAILYALIAGVVVYFGVAFRLAFLTDWDSFGYAFLGTHQRSSSSYLGRWWYVAVLNGVWLVASRVFGVPLERAHEPMQLVSLAMACLAATGMAAWTRRLVEGGERLGRGAALWAAAIVVAGPTFWIYSTAVMTEAMALAATTWGFNAWQRALERPPRAALWAAAGGFLFGVAVDIREPLVVLAAWPALSCLIPPRRSPGRVRLLGAGLGGAVASLLLGTLGGWAWSWRRGFGYFESWRGYVHWITEATDEYPTDYSRNLDAVLEHLEACAPALTPALALILVALATDALWRLAPRRRSGEAGARPTLPRIPATGWVAVSAGPYLLTLLVNPDLPFNTRYSLPLAWMLAPLAGEAAARWVMGREPGATPAWRRWASLRAMAAGAALVAATMWTAGPIARDHFRTGSSIARLRSSVLALPPDAVLFPGNGTPVAQYMRRMGIRRDLTLIQAGWNFPFDRVGEIIGEALAAGRPVYVQPYRYAWSRRDTISRQWRGLFDASVPYTCDPMEARTAPFVRLHEAGPGDLESRDPARLDIEAARILPCLRPR